MRPWGHGTTLARIVVATATIYALLLGAFVPRSLVLPAEAAALSICLHDGSAAPADGIPAHDHRGCCTAAPHPAPLPVLASAWLPVLWPAASPSPAALRPEADPFRTGPPVRATSPRGPPAV